MPIPRLHKNDFIAGYVLIKLKPISAVGARSTGAPDIYTQDVVQARLSSAMGGAQMTADVGHNQWTEWKLPEGVDLKEALAAAKHDPSVVVAEPLHRTHALLSTPNDGDWGVFETDSSVVLNFGDTTQGFDRLWHLEDDNAFAAWSVYPGQWYTAANKPKNAPLIAIVDSGCDMNHPDFINAGGNSTDSLSGGQLVTSLSGSFANGAIDPAGDPTDLNGHGTHVTGIALASGNNGSYNGHGTIGVGYNSRGMILKVIGADGSGSDLDAAAAIMYAADKGADVVNLSLGTLDFSYVFQDAVTYAWQKGTLVVCAGNENGAGGGDLGPIYPAACSGALGVTANGPGYGSADDFYAGSGYFVGVAAPGGDVVLPDDVTIMLQYVFSTACRYECGLSQNPNLQPPYTLDYTYLVGTSMACPNVSGAAGLYYGKYNLHQADGYANLRAYHAIERSAFGSNGVPNGAWEPVQGYGSLDVAALVNDSDARGATVGGVEGIIYYNGTVASLVRVTAVATNGSGTYQTTSHTDGIYRFDGMPAGTYDVTAAPFGASKTKRVVVRNGSDTPGVDFLAGTVTYDVTPPVISKFGLAGVTPTSIDVDQNAYDPESGIDSIVVKVGTTPGGSDLMAPTAVATDSPRIHITGFSVPTNFCLTVTYTNGAGLQATASRSAFGASDDSFIRDGAFVNSVFGGLGYTEVKAGPAGLNRLSLFKFDISHAGTNVAAASLRLWGNNWTFGVPPQPIAVIQAKDNWSESTLTWANQPQMSGIFNTTNVSGIYPSYNAWDVTYLVKQARAAGKTSISFYLAPTLTVSSSVTQFFTKESSLPPRLIIVSSN